MTVQTQTPARHAARLTLAFAAIAGLILALSVAGAVQAAERNTICHATGSATNPFNAITIDEGAATDPHIAATGTTGGHVGDFLLPFGATDEQCAAAASSQTPAPSVPASIPASVPASVEGSQLGATGTPAPSLANTALGLPGSGSLATILFGAILIASLGALAYANVAAVRSRR